MTTENLGEAGGAGRREGATNANGSTVNGHARPPSQKERLSRISVPGRPDLVAYKIPPPPAGFPKLNEHALAGIVGDAVRASCDATDVHPAGVVGAVLSLVSAALGRSHYITFNARHYGQTFVALVGDSALGRKGESSTGPDLIYQATEERLMGMHASKPFPLGHSLKRDLQPSSGEGLIYEIRDREEPSEKKKDEDLDPGVVDKRARLYFPELASFFDAAKRGGNNVSSIFRMAWDGGALKPGTKRDRIQATNHHISMLANITPDELRHKLDANDIANGVSNRILWVCTRQTRIITRPVGVSSATAQGIGNDLAEILLWAHRAAEKRPGGIEMTMSEDAQAEWDQIIYISIFEDMQNATGVTRSVLTRSHPQVLRLATRYALLDCSSVIEARHLASAYAFWEYSRDSARFLFGKRHALHEAQQVLDALAEQGEMSHTAIRNNIFGRREPSKSMTLKELMDRLINEGLVTSRRDRPKSGKGREPTYYQLAEEGSQ